MARKKELIATRMVEIREKNAMSQEQAAAKAGVTLRQWQRWEAGESVPYPRNLEVVASRFGMSVGDFFDEDVAAPSTEVVAFVDLATAVARVEAKLDLVLSHLGLEVSPGELDPFAEALDDEQIRHALLSEATPPVEPAGTARPKPQRKRSA